MTRKAILAGACLLGCLLQVSAQESEDWRSIDFFKRAIFYDGYQSEVVDKDVNDGILRLSNYRYAKRMTDEDLSWFGTDLQMKVKIEAACDNYDRLGNISLAFVPKGSESYDPEDVDRIEIGRFITPFMNKNRAPGQVPYSYNVPALSLIFRDASLREKYDFWLEFEVFGMPYSANQQVSGCAGRNDVFVGSLSFDAISDPAPLTTDNVLVPIVMKKTEIFGPVNFNRYKEEATDTLGTATRTYKFNVPEDVSDARIILITSNHGANENGEEYVRRRHLLYYDGEIAMDYMPGGVSCEPYRQYNTQGNFIYGTEPDMDFWLNYSNWCPGAVIPTRELHLGRVSAGEHSIMLRVPDAEFADDQGDFYVSAYFQGSKSGEVPSYVEDILPDAAFSFERDGDTLRFKGVEPAAEACIYSYDGRLLYGKHNPGEEISLVGFDNGIYIVSVRTKDGRASVYKMTVGK